MNKSSNVVAVMLCVVIIIQCFLNTTAKTNKVDVDLTLPQVETTETTIDTMSINGMTVNIDSNTVTNIYTEEAKNITVNINNNSNAVVTIDAETVENITINIDNNSNSVVYIYAETVINVITNNSNAVVIDAVTIK